MRTSRSTGRSYGESGLTRVERESVAVAVSAANDCHY
ncbi:MAG: carboxymuconolactone decarboxylase family protein [Thermoleophilaceae bacterium]